MCFTMLRNLYLVLHDVTVKSTLTLFSVTFTHLCVKQRNSILLLLQHIPWARISESVWAMQLYAYVGENRVNVILTQTSNKAKHQFRNIVKYINFWTKNNLRKNYWMMMYLNHFHFRLVINKIPIIAIKYNFHATDFLSEFFSNQTHLS